MKRIGKLVLAICMLTACMTSTAFAAGWTTGQGENGSRWWYDLGNGQYYGKSAQEVEWQWLDGNGDGIAECYAFDREGYFSSDKTELWRLFLIRFGVWSLLPKKKAPWATK